MDLTSITTACTQTALLLAVRSTVASSPVDALRVTGESGREKLWSTHRPQP